MVGAEQKIFALAATALRRTVLAGPGASFPLALWKLRFDLLLWRSAGLYPDAVKVFRIQFHGGRL